MPNGGVQPGTLVMLVLRILQSGPMHGYAIAQRIHALSNEQLQIEEGSLYPALQRILLKDGPKPTGAFGTTAGALLPPHACRPAPTASRCDYERINAAIRTVLRTA